MSVPYRQAAVVLHHPLSVRSRSIKTLKTQSSLYLHCVWTLVALFQDGKMMRSSSALAPLEKCSSKHAEKGDVWRRSSELTGWDEEKDCSRHICDVSPGVRWAGLLEKRAPVLLTASPGSCSSQQVTNGRSIYRARRRRAARIVTSGSSRHIITCRQALTVGPSGEIKKDSCVSYTALSAELPVRPCQDVIIIILLIRTVQGKVISFWSLTDSYVSFSCLICRSNTESLPFKISQFKYCMTKRGMGWISSLQMSQNQKPMKDRTNRQTDSRDEPVYVWESVACFPSKNLPVLK